MLTVSHHDPAAVHAPSGATTWGLSTNGTGVCCSSAVRYLPACSDRRRAGRASRRNAYRRGDSVLAAAGLGVVHLVKVNTCLTDRCHPRDPRAPTTGRRTNLDHDDRRDARFHWLLEFEAIAAV
jgi:2-iminobutanoate/2-iminopropanoate deaminase